MNSTSIAFLGLGNMGGGMAARLAGAGFPIAVWNRNPRVADRFRDLGATVATSPAEAANGADVVISMVADDAAARAVWLGESGALASMQPGTVLIECSTISPSWVDELSLAATRRRCVVLDAPVTGSKTQAASGEPSSVVRMWLNIVPPSYCIPCTGKQGTPVGFQGRHGSSLA